MILRIYTTTSCILALIVIYCIVAPVFVSAAEQAVISNSASASSYTGGQSGADGKDGRDGEPGTDGEDGRDGEHVSTGDSSASVHIKTTLEGSAIVERDIATTSDGSASVHIESVTGFTGEATATSGTVEGKAVGDVNAAADPSPVSAQSTSLGGILASLKSILLYYVDILF